MIKKRKGETSYKETIFGIIPRSRLIPLEIEGIKKAWDFVLNQHSRGKISVTPLSLQKIHKIAFGWIFPEISGKFRNIEVIVSKHKPPRFHQVATLMKDFTEDLKIRLKYLPNIDNVNFLSELTDLLAWAHHRFLWIHPFTDYNGRIGRLLINIILLNLNLPPIELKVETKRGRTKYVAALQKSDEGHYDKLKQLMRSALEEAVREFS